MSTARERNLQRKVEKLEAKNKKLTDTLLKIGEIQLLATIELMNDEQEKTYYERFFKQGGKQLGPKLQGT